MYGFNVADQIGDNFYPIYVVICDFQAGELIFERYHQLQTVEPIGAQIISEVRFIRNTTDANAKVAGNKRADILCGKGCFDSRPLVIRY
jgi:hypothetical protein